jgi:hypothetical protein
MSTNCYTGLTARNLALSVMAVWTTNVYGCLVPLRYSMVPFESSGKFNYAGSVIEQSMCDNYTPYITF